MELHNTFDTFLAIVNNTNATAAKLAEKGLQRIL